MRHPFSEYPDDWPMRTEYHSMKTELDTANWPLDPSVIPNHMGINLCSVEGMSWTRQADRQLVSLTIHFEPNPDGDPRDKMRR
jgi:hypothetical protein